MTETIASLLAGHRSGERAVSDTVRRVFCRIREIGDPAIFISLRDEASVLADAEKLAGADRSLPLYGIPVAIKDNIDVAGLPTTAACPAFAYTPAARRGGGGAARAGRRARHRQDQPRPVRHRPRRHALALRHAAQPAAGRPRQRRLQLGLGSGCGEGHCAAGARHGHGRLRQGAGRLSTTSSGSSPVLGLVSTAGVVPACRSLDCVSIFALTVDDAFAALAGDRRR